MNTHTKYNRPHRSARCLGIMAAALALILPGCLSTEQMAPPVLAPLIEAGTARGITSDTLERGRMIYLNQCITCHTIEPVDRYTWHEWDELLPEMNTEAKLNVNQAGDLRAYLQTAHEMMMKEK